MAQSRSLLIGLGAAVAVAAVVLVWLISRDPASADAPAVATRDTFVPAAGSALPGKPAPPKTAQPRLPGESTATPAAGDDYKEYVVDGQVIRDHRKGNRPPPDLPIPIHPPGSHRIQATLTRDISERVKAAVRECAASVPPEARGAKPRTEGQVTIAIKDHQVTVNKALFQLREIVGAAEQPTKECIESKVKAIGLAAPDEIDLDAYTISVNFAIL